MVYSLIRLDRSYFSTMQNFSEFLPQKVFYCRFFLFFLKGPFAQGLFSLPLWDLIFGWIIHGGSYFRNFMVLVYSIGGLSLPLPNTYVGKKTLLHSKVHSAGIFVSLNQWLYSRQYTRNYRRCRKETLMNSQCNQIARYWVLKAAHGK